MIGCRPLLDGEIDAIVAKLDSTRDKCLFILGIRTGYRISELLSIKASDVYQYNGVVDRLNIRRANTKGKVAGQSVALHVQAKELIAALIAEDGLLPGDFLFKSRRSSRPIDAVRAYRILRQAADACNLTGKIATHSMRKTFAKRIYKKLDRDLIKMRQAMRHKDINSTIAYLSFDQSEIDAAILTD